MYSPSLILLSPLSESLFCGKGKVQLSYDNYSIEGHRLHRGRKKKSCKIECSFLNFPFVSLYTGRYNIYSLKCLFNTFGRH